MPVSGLVVTFTAPGPEAEAAMAWMRGDARFEVADPESAADRRLPVTLDTADREEDKQLWQQMQDHPGIVFVDVACVFFEDDAEASRLQADTAEPTPEATSHARSRPW